MTYPEAVAPSQAETLRSRTKLLVEVVDFMEAVLVNLAWKLFIIMRVKHSKRIDVCFEKNLECECAQ